MRTRVITIDPTRLVLLEVNARFMRHEVFTRLVENIKRDKVLTQLPFCALLGYYREGDEVPTWEDGTKKYEVLSGNHRVKAAIAAGLKTIEVQVTDDPLSPDERRAIQLSHNAIAGEDDPAILKTVYESIEDLDMRAYSGLDDKVLQLLANVETATLAEAGLDFQTITMTFLPDERAEVEAIWEQVKERAAGSKAVWLARWSEYDKFLDSLEAGGASYSIRNTATALLIVLEVFSRHIGDLAEGWLDEQGEAIKGAGQIPLATVLNGYTVPARVGAQLKKVIDRLTGRGEIKEPWEALERLASAYLAQGEKA